MIFEVIKCISGEFVSFGRLTKLIFEVNEIELTMNIPQGREGDYHLLGWFARVPVVLRSYLDPSMKFRHC